MKQSYTTDDLMFRYNVSRPAITKFVNAHLEEINADNIIHAKKVGKDWYFDAEAVRIIDGLKNRGVTVVDDAMQADRLSELQEQIIDLQKQLAAEKDENKLAQKKIIALLEQNKNVALLEQTTKRAEQAEAEVKSLQAQAKNEAEERGLLKAQIKAKENQIQGIERQIAELKQQHEAELTNVNAVNQSRITELEKQHNAITEKLQQDITNYNNRSFWQKLKDLF